ncbi:MAG: 4a-hydroxytetrahydrobiopterin dehydratase, partial [Alkalispirochaetaceae bacterium]
MSDFARQSCVPCKGGEPPLREEEIRERLGELREWELVREGEVPRLRRSYKFKNFAQALAFTDAVGAEAEEQG